MIYFILLFITFSLSKQCSEYTTNEIDTVDSAFECIESIETTEKENNDIITGLKYYLEAYVFKDILKNPPQPSFSNNYYEKVDIDAELNKINTKTTSMYEFYSQIKNLIISTRDGHLGFNVDDKLNKPKSELTNFFYFLPFTINIDNDKKMYLIPRKSLGGIPIDVPEEIDDNQNIAVKTINGEDPFNIIREFGKKYMRLKCPHAQFTEARSVISIGSLSDTPLTKEYLNTPITITWENEESVTINYSIFKLSTPNKSLKELLQGEEVKQGIQPKLTPEEIKSRKELVKRMKTKQGRNKPHKSDDNKVYCSLSDNKINTFVITSFDPKDAYVKSYEDTILKCIDLFDSNKYPIQLIFPKNGGGDYDYSQWVQKILAPYDDVNDIESGRISDLTEDIMRRGYGTYIYDPETCERREKGINPQTLGEWYTNPNIIKYGDVEHKVSQPSTENWEAKKIMKNPRKPTEIVVYTDSFCYSACSEVTKGLKEWGGAILVGFDGDPNGKDEEFEVGLSPTVVIDLNDIDKNNIIKQYGYKVGISIIETYRYNYEYNESIPREFLTDMIDERVNIYQFDYSDETIKEFEEETKKIIEKYQTKCNPKNKRLVKRDEKCDKEINIEHGHGGYECGDNGEWSTKCVLSYCDEGYKFDYINNNCIEDVCVNPPTDNGTPNMTVNLVMIIIGIITLIL
ncbi:hypothetical protein EDI_126730 [Entamoeba dispar SAW760]|uniref:Uncharacterized protein n=1 Tax=Entamoeba dispar (strain ATCC PRA-260 / SAW760) TaxID=370354 RepID=B0EJ26_ENTDS|nr:uncharacterized protein EDI_126730 [Entamoeba dispar SAW760]EDR25470.1 hypothetical protein EDI_126730 [Entamoeba dispar SAW760]|eukprot:EDR25470.1 hypothetical protein EDI_126730 [Entamoeba dispar SAW760]